MTKYSDEEFEIHALESGGYGCGSTGELWQSNCSKLRLLSDDIVDIIAEYSCELLTDQLVFSLLSSQHQSVVSRQLRRFVSPSCKGSLLQLGHFVEYFLNWSEIRFGADPEFVAASDTDDVLSFYCKECHQLIITQNEVESPHYHGGNGPAFLAHRVFNCHHSADEGYETQFTTGIYRVCDVTCLGCDTRVGKKYIEARDYANHFKVGKILLEQTLLTLPQCCAGNRLFTSDHYFCSRDTSSTSFCSVCFEKVRSAVFEAVLTMTKNLDPALTAKLLSLLKSEKTSPHSSETKGRFGLGRLVGKDTCMSRVVGTRLAMLPDSQNWIQSVKFLHDLADNQKAGLIKSVLLESLVAHCGPLKFHSAALLMSRVETLEERKSVMTGIEMNPNCVLSPDEHSVLHSIVSGYS